jgi:hypothetical protein
MIAGAETCANPDFEKRSAAMMLPPVIAERRRKRRRVILPKFLRSMSPLLFENA